MGIFAEGIESIRLACSIVLLVPALAAVLVGRFRPAAVATWISVVVAISWLRFVAWWPFDTAGFAHALGGALLVVLVALAWTGRSERAALDLVAVALAAALAAWAWIPCVGRELGELLNAARDEPWAQLLPTIAFMLGHFLPVVVVAAVAVLVPRFADQLERPIVRRIGLAGLALVGSLVAVTLFDDLAGELARRSSF